MAFHRLKEDDESFLTGQRYAHAIRLALVLVLLGGVFLAASRFLQWPSGSETRFLLSRITEILGWMFLTSSTVFLFTEWQTTRQGKRSLEHILKRPVGPDRWVVKTSNRISAARVAGSREDNREEAIDRLYSELRPLLSRAATDPSLKEEAQRKLALLRKLQDEEAEEIQKRFEASLLLKPGEGYQALERAREILARYEDPPSAHATTQQKN